MKFSPILLTASAISLTLASAAYADTNSFGIAQVPGNYDGAHLQVGEYNIIDGVQTGTGNTVQAMRQEGLRNTQSFKQEGKNNTISGMKQEGERNTVTVHQYGLKNDANTVQNGVNNLTDIIQVNQNGNSNNSVNTNQTGTDNSISSYQAGRVNTAGLLSQDGESNKLTLKQTGAGNTATGIDQKGTKNKTNLVQTGYLNKSSIVQAGDQNVVDVQQTNDADSDASNKTTVTQLGGHENVIGITQDGSANNAKVEDLNNDSYHNNLTVVQKGIGHVAVVSHTGAESKQAFVQYGTRNTVVSNTRGLKQDVSVFTQGHDNVINYNSDGERNSGIITSTQAVNSKATTEINGTDNNSSIEQTGFVHNGSWRIAHTDIASTRIEGAGNTTKILQQGPNNTGRASAIGTGNSASVHQWNANIDLMENSGGAHAVGVNNKATVGQVGNGNAAGARAYGIGNTASVGQVGVGNIGRAIVNSGTNFTAENNSASVEQFGYRNWGEIYLTGDADVARIYQDGNDNYGYLITGTGLNGVESTINGGTSGNFMLLRQVGNRNVAVTRIGYGSNNDIRTFQTGSYNNDQVTVWGNGNAVVVNDQGNYNNSNIQLAGSNNRANLTFVSGSNGYGKAPTTIGFNGNNRVFNVVRY